MALLRKLGRNKMEQQEISQFHFKEETWLKRLSEVFPFRTGREKARTAGRMPSGVGLPEFQEA